MFGWGQDGLNVAGSNGIGLTGIVRNFGGGANFMPKSKVMRNKPSFNESLHKYQKIAKKKQNNWLGDDQRRNSSLPKAKKHQRSSHWSSSFIPSMHMPWNA
jgi:hypothetical protein